MKKPNLIGTPDGIEQMLGDLHRSPNTSGKTRVVVKYTMELWYALMELGCGLTNIPLSPLDVIVYAKAELDRLRLLTKNSSGRYWFEVAAEHLTTVVKLEEENKRLKVAAETPNHPDLDKLSILAWIADSRGYKSFYNARVYEFTGMDQSELQGFGWERVHHPDYVSRVWTRARVSLDTGVVWEDVFPLRNRDGVFRMFLGQARPYTNAAGEVEWWGQNTDITNLPDRDRNALVVMPETLSRLQSSG